MTITTNNFDSLPEALAGEDSFVAMGVVDMA